MGAGRLSAAPELHHRWKMRMALFGAGSGVQGRWNWYVVGMSVNLDLSRGIESTRYGVETLRVNTLQNLFGAYLTSEGRLGRTW